MDFKTEEYTKDLGTIRWQDGFLKELEGLSIEEQLRCYAWTTYKQLTEVPYSQLESKCREDKHFLDSIEQVEPEIVLVKEGKIVGVKRVKFYHICADGSVLYDYECIRPYERYCYASTDDNNGAGYKETDWYKYLICLPANHTLW